MKGNPMVMFTLEELTALIGRQAVLTTGQERLRVLVDIQDAKQSYGRTRVAVTPVAGPDQKPVWVDFSRVTGVVAKPTKGGRR